MEAEQAKPDRKPLYGMLIGVAIAALLVLAYILTMKSAGHQLDAAWDKKWESQGFEIVEEAPPPPVKAFENASCPPRAVGTKAPDPSKCQ